MTENYYSLLGVEKSASGRDIKKAFRERAKRLHPDIAGKNAEEQMRRLLSAYEVLSDRDRRFKYDRAYERFMGKSGFDYRKFLKDRGDGESLSKLIFFDFLHLEDDEAVELWTRAGALDFPLKDYLDREDWMDCAFILAEELDRRNRTWEAFVLLLSLVREERRRPYFKHFMEELEQLLGELVKTKLRAAVDRERYAACLETLLGMGFPSKLEKRWKALLVQTLFELGERQSAEAAKQTCPETSGFQANSAKTRLLWRK